MSPRIDPVRAMYMKKFGIVTNRPQKRLSVKMLAQLSQCKTDEARRLILGISKTKPAPKH